MEKKKVSLVIPMYYEEEVANECYERVQKILKGLEKYDYEIIFINDEVKINIRNIRKYCFKR